MRLSHPILATPAPRAGESAARVDGAWPRAVGLPREWQVATLATVRPARKTASLQTALAACKRCGAVTGSTRLVLTLKKLGEQLERIALLRSLVAGVVDAAWTRCEEAKSVSAPEGAAACQSRDSGTRLGCHPAWRS